MPWHDFPRGARLPLPRVSPCRVFLPGRRRGAGGRAAVTAPSRRATLDGAGSRRWIFPSVDKWRRDESARAAWQTRRGGGRSGRSQSSGLNLLMRLDRRFPGLLTISAERAICLLHRWPTLILISRGARLVAKIIKALSRAVGAKRLAGTAWKKSAARWTFLSIINTSIYNTVCLSLLFTKLVARARRLIC